MATIARKYLAHYIDAAPQGSDTPVYERIGKDLETFSPELAAQVETKKNVLGETAVHISGYQKTAAVEPYYADSGTALFDKLQDILDSDKILDDLRTQVVEVKLWDGEGSSYPAVKEEAYIEITSYGGDTAGYQIPFVLHYTGSKEKGTFDVESKTFSKA